MASTQFSNLNSSGKAALCKRRRFVNGLPWAIRSIIVRFSYRARNKLLPKLAPEREACYASFAKPGWLMLFLRIFGKALLLLAFLAAAYDGACLLATTSEGLVLTSLSTHLKTYVPDAFNNLEHFFLAAGAPFLWTGILRPLLGAPVCILSGVLGAALFLAGYRRPPPEIVPG
jgi:hypothetical protein